MEETMKNTLGFTCRYDILFSPARISEIYLHPLDERSQKRNSQVVDLKIMRPNTNAERWPEKVDASLTMTFTLGHFKCDLRLQWWPEILWRTLNFKNQPGFQLTSKAKIGVRDEKAGTASVGVLLMRPFLEKQESISAFYEKLKADRD